MISDLTPDSDALKVSLLAEIRVSQRALKAMRRVRELEREVMLLRATFANAKQDTAWKEKVFSLISKLVLLRVAVAEEATLGSRDDAWLVPGRNS